MRLTPSKLKGFVTTPTASAPASRAIFAITGAAPVPVPPPMPAVMKTISAPSSTALIRSVSSSAAFLPISGLAPAPRPRVRPAPIWTLTGTRARSSTCRSVLVAMNSTLWMPAFTMVLTAFPPPPPTPITLIRAGNFCSSSNWIMGPSFGSSPRSSPATKSMMSWNCMSILSSMACSPEGECGVVLIAVPPVRHSISLIHFISRFMTPPPPNLPGAACWFSAPKSTSPTPVA